MIWSLKWFKATFETFIIIIFWESCINLFAGASPAGGKGGIAPPIFLFAPPIWFLPPHGMFLGGKSFWLRPKIPVKNTDFGQKMPSVFGEDLFFFFVLEITWFRPENDFGFRRRSFFFFFFFLRSPDFIRKFALIQLRWMKVWNLREVQRRFSALPPLSLILLPRSREAGDAPACFSKIPLTN